MFYISLQMNRYYRRYDCENNHDREVDEKGIKTYISLFIIADFVVHKRKPFNDLSLLNSVATKLSEYCHSFFPSLTYYTEKRAVNVLD